MSRGSVENNEQVNKGSIFQMRNRDSCLSTSLAMKDAPSCFLRFPQKIQNAVFLAECESFPHARRRDPAGVERVREALLSQGGRKFRKEGEDVGGWRGKSLEGS
mgnify:FL=1